MSKRPSRVHFTSSGVHSAHSTASALVAPRLHRRQHLLGVLLLEELRAGDEVRPARCRRAPARRRRGRCPSRPRRASRATARAGRAAGRAARVSNASARCASSVTMTNRSGVVFTAPRACRLPAIVRLRLVQRVHRDLVEPVLERVALRVAARLAAHEERNLLQLLLRIRQPARIERDRAGLGAAGATADAAAAIAGDLSASWRSAVCRRPDPPPSPPTRARCAGGSGAAPSANSKSSRNICSRCSSSPIMSGCTHVSKITLAPSKPICGE